MMLANLFLVVAAVAATDAVFNVSEFGAKGDGTAADSAAVQRALDAAAKCSGTVWFPAGTYRVHDLKVASGVMLKGDPKWIYRSDLAGAVLQLDSAEAKCCIDISQAFGVRIVGLLLNGDIPMTGRMAERQEDDWGLPAHRVHGILMDHGNRMSPYEDCPVIESTKVQNFSGDGLRLWGCWCMTIRHSQFAFNGGNGVTHRGYDGFVSDNQFSGNLGSGFSSALGSSTVAFTANRVECNHAYGLRIASWDGGKGLQGTTWNVTGCNFDCNHKAGLYFEDVIQSTVMGNVFHRSGEAQIVLEGCKGVAVVGNTSKATRAQFAKDTFVPAAGMVLKDLASCVVKDNVFWRGYCERLIDDKGGHSDGTVIRDNVGTPMEVRK